MLSRFFFIFFLHLIAFQSAQAVNMQEMERNSTAPSRCSDICYSVSKGCGLFWDSNVGKFTIVVLGVGAALGLGILIGYLIWEDGQDATTNRLCEPYPNITLTDQQFIDCLITLSGENKGWEGPSDINRMFICNKYQGEYDRGKC